MTQEMGAIEAQRAAVAVATASICNEEGAHFLRSPEGPGHTSRTRSATGNMIGTIQSETEYM